MFKRRKRIVIWTNFHGKLKIAMVVLLLMLTAVIFSYELPVRETWTAWSMPLSGTIIAVDAGHGGPDGGAVSREGVIEKNITLSVSLYLRDYLQQSGAVVVMTREQDQDLANPGTNGLRKRKTEDLIQRVRKIKNNKADLLVSIHLNSIASSRWSGAQTFYNSKNKESKELATFIQKQLIHSLKNTDRTANSSDSLYLLKTLPIPSVLVELGFLSNPGEADLLTQTKYQKKLAAAIYEGIIRYYSGENIGAN